MIRAVVYDADKTLWDHHNVSEFVEPIKIESQDTVVDSEGRKLVLFPEVKETLGYIKSKGLLLGMATWNFEDKVMRILSLLGIDQYFDVVVARSYPYKFIMLAHFINSLRRKGIRIRPSEILFVDDRRLHFGNIWYYIGDIKCLEMWKDLKSHKELIGVIESIMKGRNA
jgi:magnesium-dependent phosphatase-1